MSTRCTLAYDQRSFHLYQECFENDNVYLQLEGTEWGASLDTDRVDWRDGDSLQPSLLLRVDVTLWRKIVEGWMSSQWGQDPSFDHKKVEWDPEGYNKWLESLKLKTEKRDE